MSLLTRDLFILMDSAIIWIYFRYSQPPISLTVAAFQFKGTLAITLTWLFHQISFKGHLMWILLPRRHLLLLLSLVVLVVVVVVVVVVMVVAVIVQVAVVVVVKSWPKLVNNKLEARASKCKFGPRTAKYKFGVRAGKHIFGVRAVKYKLGGRAGKHKLGARTGKCKSEARAGKYKLGARARVRGQANGRGREIQISSRDSISATGVLTTCLNNNWL